MASALAVSSRVLVLVVALCVCNEGARAQQGCNSQVGVLLPCLRFVQGQDSQPSASCCNGLGVMVKNSPLCLCAIVNAGPGSAAPGVNATLALLLPSKCNMKGLNPSLCNGALQAASPAPAQARGPTSGDSARARQGAGALPTPTSAPVPRSRGSSMDEDSPSSSSSNSPTSASSASSALSYGPATFLTMAAALALVLH